MSRTDYELSVSYPSGEGLDPKDRDDVLARYVLEADGFAGLREGERPETGALSGWDKRWDPDEDLIPLSRQHPNLLFTIWGQNEEDEGPFTVIAPRKLPALAEGRNRSRTKDSPLKPPVVSVSFQ